MSEPLTKAGEIVLLTSGTSGISSACVFDLPQLMLNATRHMNSIGQNKQTAFW